MKDTINYNYNLNIETLEDFDTYYRFEINNEFYYFVPFNRSEKEINEVVECSRELKTKNINCHDIILNRNNQIITNVSNDNYILLKINGDVNKVYTMIDILELNNSLCLVESKIKKYQNNWDKMWSDKIDYFEYQIREKGKDKEVLLNSFSYYVGLTENAISYINQTKRYLKPNDLDKVTLCHRRLFYPNVKLNYLNPLSFIFDLEVRDIAEYIKGLFFYGEESDAYIELDYFLKSRKLSRYGYQMFIARLLYPSYYFDVYERVMSNELFEEKIIDIIKKVDNYEKFLNHTFIIISRYSIIESIEWLNKKEL